MAVFGIAARSMSHRVAWPRRIAVDTAIPERSDERGESEAKQVRRRAEPAHDVKRATMRPLRSGAPYRHQYRASWLPLICTRSPGRRLPGDCTSNERIVPSLTCTSIR